MGTLAFDDANLYLNMMIPFFSHLLCLADLSSGWVHLPAATAVAIQWSKRPLKIVLGIRKGQLLFQLEF